MVAAEELARCINFILLIPSCHHPENHYLLVMNFLHMGVLVATYVRIRGQPYTFTYEKKWRAGKRGTNCPLIPILCDVRLRILTSFARALQNYIRTS